MDAESAKYIAAGFCMAIGSIAPALGEGYIAGRAMESMARNPQVMDRIFTNMIVGMAITESTGIYSLVVALIILFV
jgi:F-type H+-transporting ATPase subunit c